MGLRNVVLALTIDLTRSRIPGKSLSEELSTIPMLDRLVCMSVNGDLS